MRTVISMLVSMGMMMPGQAMAVCVPSTVRPQLEAAKAKIRDNREQFSQCSEAVYQNTTNQPSKASCLTCRREIINQADALIPLTDRAVAQEEALACQGAEITAKIAGIAKDQQEALEAAQREQTTHAAEVERTRASNMSALREAMATCREKIREACKDDISKPDQGHATKLREACGESRDVVSRFITEKLASGVSLGQVAGLAGLAAAGMGVLAALNKGGGSNVTGGSSMAGYPSGATAPTPTNGSLTSSSPMLVSNLGAPKAGTTSSLPVIGKAGSTAASSEAYHSSSSWTQGTGGSFAGDSGTYDPNNKGGHVKKPEFGAGGGGGGAGGGSMGSARGLASGPGGSLPGGGRNDGAGGQLSDDVNLAGGIASAKALTGLKGGTEALEDLELNKSSAGAQPPLDDLGGAVGGGAGKGEVASGKGDIGGASESLFVRMRKKYGTLSKRYLVSP